MVPCTARCASMISALGAPPPIPGKAPPREARAISFGFVVLPREGGAWYAPPLKTRHIFIFFITKVKG